MQQFAHSCRVNRADGKYASWTLGKFVNLGVDRLERQTEMNLCGFRHVEHGGAPGAFAFNRQIEV